MSTIKMIKFSKTCQESTCSLAWRATVVAAQQSAQVHEQYYGWDNIMGVTILWVWQYYGCDNIMDTTILWVWQYFGCYISWVTILRGLLSLKQPPSMIIMMATPRYLRESARLPALDQDHHRWRGVRGFRLICSGLIQNTYIHITWI